MNTNQAPINSIELVANANPPLTDINACINRMNELVTAFTTLSKAMNNCNEAFNRAMTNFDAVAPFQRPPPIDTATPAAAKAAEAIAAETAAETAAASRLSQRDTIYANHLQRTTALSAKVEEYRAAFRALAAQHKGVPRPDVSAHYEASRLLAKYQEYERGCVRTLDGRRHLIYKFHVFEIPKNRIWNAPGPLVSVGNIHPETMKIEKNIAPPPLPTIAGDWPWAVATY